MCGDLDQISTCIPSGAIYLLLTTLQSNSGKQVTSPACNKVGKHIENIKYEEEGNEILVGDI